MKVYKFFFFLFLLSFNWYCFWYQHDWFLKYQEWEEWINFECEEQCTISLWERKNLELLTLNWIISWTGVFIITSKDWGRDWLLYRDEVSIHGNARIFFDNYEKLLYNIPRDKILLIEFNWDIKWNLNINLISYSFSQKILKSRKDFWAMESIYQNSMNLRNGISIRWISIIKYWYILFMLSIVWVFIFVKWKGRQKFKMIFYIGLWLFLFIWIRNTITYTYILHQWLSWFKANKEFYDLEDFLPFTEKIRDKLELSFEKKVEQGCKIFMEPHWNRNIDDHWWFYFKPCEQVFWEDEADYKIYYKRNILPKDFDKQVLLEFNGSYLLDNKSR